MKRYRWAVALFLTVLICASADGQTPRLLTKRPIEFHLAEDLEGLGLIAVHVEGEARVIYVHPEVQLDDRDIRRASVVRDAAGQPAVQVRLSSAGVQKFNALAEGRQYKPLAIAANNKVIAAPVIEGKLVNDVLDITGVFTVADATSLARALNK